MFRSIEACEERQNSLKYRLLIFIGSQEEKNDKSHPYL